MEYIFRPYGHDLFRPIILKGGLIKSESEVEIIEKDIEPKKTFVFIKDLLGNQMSVRKDSLMKLPL